MPVDPAAHHPPALRATSARVLGTSSGAGDKQPVMEREGGDVIFPEVEVHLRPSTADAQGSQLAAPLVTAARGELVVDSAPMARTPVRRQMEKAASAPRPVEVGSASSSTPDTEATSAAPPGWMFGGSIGLSNVVV